MKNVHFAIPEIYGESLSYYELLRKLVNKMNEMIENYDTIPDQIAEAVANLDASQLFTAVLAQLIDSIATDNTKSTNAVKVYKKHDLLYATFNENVNLYESLIDFSTGTETELIIGTNIREVNISELFIELRKLIEDETQSRERADTALQTNIDNETQSRERADTALQTNIDNETQARVQADNTKVNKTDVLTLEEIQASSDLNGKVASAGALLASIPIKYLDSEGTTDESARGNTYQATTNIEPIGARLIYESSKDITEGFALVNTKWQNTIYLTILNYNFNLQANKSFKARLYYVDKF